MYGSYSSKQFTFHAPSNTFVAEASTLQMRTVPSSISLTIEATGKQEAFKLVGNELNGDGDVVAWKFKGVDHEVAILND